MIDKKTYEHDMIAVLPLQVQKFVAISISICQYLERHSGGDKEFCDTNFMCCVYVFGINLIRNQYIPKLINIPPL